MENPHMAEDPKGRLIGPYLLKIRENIQEGIQFVNKTVKASLEKLKMAESALGIQQRTMRLRDRESFVQADLVKESIMLHRVQMVRKSVFWEVNDPQNIQITFNRTSLLHIMINLVKNAIEAIHDSPEKRITVDLIEDEEQVIIKVKDRGMGITPEVLAQLFSHGFTTKNEGNGFGLHFCRQVLEAEGASIKASSEGVGKGSCFQICLPKG